jgi:hypothetical protein
VVYEMLVGKELGGSSISKIQVCPEICLEALEENHKEFY